MRTTVSTVWRLVLAAALVALALPAFAADLVIENGSDLWRTPGDGTTYAKFDTDPIPRDFFCSGSRPFSGRIDMQGVPIATRPRGVLGNTDTIVHRLDDAVFNADGIATTRLQMRAMQFEGVELFRNECGKFKVGLVLDGPQPITEMKLRRTGADHGVFVAQISVNVKITFTPVGREGPALEVIREVRFPPARNVWASRPGPDTATREGYVLVDTDANGRADTYVPGTSTNFSAGWRTDGTAAVPKLDLAIQDGSRLIGDTENQSLFLAECHPDECGVHCPLPAGGSVIYVY